MILDAISEVANYSYIHPAFSKAFDYLRSHDLSELSSGRHEIVEGKMFALASITPGKGLSETKLEVHQKFIDIQCAVSGIDNIGWRPLGQCLNPMGSFDSQNDVQFFSDLPITWFGLSPATFAIFFPTDAHAPLSVNGMLHKVVIKVAVNW
jgi:biofilm protein TabA